MMRRFAKVKFTHKKTVLNFHHPSGYKQKNSSNYYEQFKINKNKDDSTSFNIESTTIDDLLLRNSCQRINILKLDVEGAEEFIFDDTDPNMVDTLSLYDLDVIPLPTYSSDEFEIAISRSLFSDTICISIREKIGNDFMPDNGSGFTYIFDRLCNCYFAIFRSRN